MKTRYVSGLLVVSAGLSFQACSGPGVDFSAPGVGESSGGDRAGAGPASAGAQHGGSAGRAGAPGSDAAGATVGDAGDIGDGGERDVAGGAGAALGGASGNAQGGIAGNGAAGASFAGTSGANPAGAGAGTSGFSAAGASASGGIGIGGGGTSDGGVGGIGIGGGGTSGGGVGGIGIGGIGIGGIGIGGGGVGGIGIGGGGTSGGGVGGIGIGGGGLGGTGGGGIVAPVCGNSVLERGEQCDDGNTAPFDACNANCAFEQSQRANWFKVQFGSDAYCRANRFGSAFPSLTRSVLQQSIDARIADGSFSLLFAFVGLADPKGPNGSVFSLAVLNGAPAGGANYDGNNDLDWWYSPSAGTLAANKTPLSSLTAQINAGAAVASGASLQLPLLSSAPLGVSSVQLRLPIGASSKPLVSTGAPPGHLATEHLSSTLVSFASAGAQTDAGAAELCGNISAASLKTEQIPATYLSDGATPCAQRYTVSNSFLDALVSGCSVSFGVQVLSATQPDAADPSVSNPGSGAPYQLIANAAHIVSACRDRNGAAVNLGDCLTAAAYSSAFKLATDRVIIK